MEACYISSRSFSKTMEAVPGIRDNKVSIFAKKKKFPSAKTRVPPLSVSCSRSTWSASLGSNQDEAGPVLINSDWRAFRARLVAKEQRGTSVLDMQQSTKGTGDKWAHRIHEPEKGCLLIATEKLDGIHSFERTVIMILSTGPIGPTGVILNRHSEMSINEVETFSLDRSGAFSGGPLFHGGPFEDGLVLMSSPKGGNDEEDNFAKSFIFEELMKGLCYGTKESVGFAADMVERNVVREGDLRFFDGYCRWERGQLMDEIRAGKWTVAACSPSVVGLSSVGRVGLWEEISGLLSPQEVL